MINDPLSLSLSPPFAGGERGSARFSLGRDIFFLPYQHEWRKDRSPLRICVKSRQVGISYVDSYDSVVKGTQMHYLKSLIAKGGLETAYQGVSRPSQPNRRRYHPSPSPHQNCGCSSPASWRQAQPSGSHHAGSS